MTKGGVAAGMERLLLNFYETVRILNGVDDPVFNWDGCGKRDPIF